MRTTDIIVAGFFSPAAVAAVGLADLYARLPLRVGLGVGDAAIALSSQDTGSDAVGNRNEAVTIALLIGLLAGVPFILFGVALSEWAIGILGAEADVIAFGAVYLAIILVSSPARHTTMIAARAIQGTGDTLTPMYVNAGANLFNIVSTIVLAFGVGPFPELSVIGIAIATALGDVLASATFLLVILSSRSELSYVVPQQWVIAKQLIVVSVPRIGDGFTELVAEFPFNAILLIFGTEVNAAYHIGRRMFTQISGPLARGYSVGTNILVGQALGRGDHADAYKKGWASAALAVLSIGGLGGILFVGAEWFVLVFTRDAATMSYAIDFARVYALAATVLALYIVIAGALRGGSETRTPFVAKFTGMFVFLLGTTYLFGIHLGYGVLAAYVGIIADFVWRNVVVCSMYYHKTWLTRGSTMMYDRGSIPTED